MNKFFCAFVLTFVTFNAMAADPKVSATGPAVKKSASGMCHERNSRFYNKVKKFTPYDNLKACVDSGGQLPAKKAKS